MTDEEQAVAADEAETPAPPPRAVGARLREAREKLGLSREEVALELHLSATQIAHLEQDEFERFAAPIFVSGYLRQYARLLGIPGDPLVQAFQARGLEPPSLQAELTATAARPRRITINVENWAPFLVAAGALILLLAWLFGGSDTEESPGEAATALGSPGALDAPVPDSLRMQTEAAAVLVPPETPAATASSVPDPVSEPRSGSPPAGASPDPPLPAAVATAPAPAAVAPAPSDTTHRLRLRFSADSWVEISDGTGRRLMFDLGRAGQERELTGEAPFSILLGYAPGVEIEYNGEPYDVSRHTRGKVARFELGEP